MSPFQKSQNCQNSLAGDCEDWRQLCRRPLGGRGGVPAPARPSSRGAGRRRRWPPREREGASPAPPPAAHRQHHPRPPPPLPQPPAHTPGAAPRSRTWRRRGRAWPGPRRSAPPEPAGRRKAAPKIPSPPVSQRPGTRPGPVGALPRPPARPLRDPARGRLEAPASRPRPREASPPTPSHPPALTRCSWYRAEPRRGGKEEPRRPTAGAQRPEPAPFKRRRAACWAEPRHAPSAAARARGALWRPRRLPRAPPRPACVMRPGGPVSLLGPVPPWLARSLVGAGLPWPWRPACRTSSAADLLCRRPPPPFPPGGLLPPSAGPSAPQGRQPPRPDRASPVPVGSSFSLGKADRPPPPPRPEWSLRKPGLGSAGLLASRVAPSLTGRRSACREGAKAGQLFGWLSGHRNCGYHRCCLVLRSSLVLLSVEKACWCLIILEYLYCIRNLAALAPHHVCRLLMRKSGYERAMLKQAEKPTLAPDYSWVWTALVFPRHGCY